MEVQSIISNYNSNINNDSLPKAIPFKSITNEILPKNQISQIGANIKNIQNFESNQEESKNYTNKENELIIIDKNPNCDNSDFITNLTLNDTEEELNSTFLFTGENENKICEPGKILSQYLQTNENESENIVLSETNSLEKNSDSSNKNNDYRKKREENYKKMMELLKEQKPIKSKNIKKQINKISVEKKKYGKKIFYIILLILNAILYVFCLINFCEPPVEELFFNDDHRDFIYKRKKLSDEKSIVIN